MKRLERTGEMMADLDFSGAERGYFRRVLSEAGVAALTGDKTRDVRRVATRLCIETISVIEHLSVFPVFEDYRDDPDFLKFISEARDMNELIR